MSYSLRGRLVTRLATALVPLIAACLLAFAVRDWWPLELAATMIGVGVVLDVVLYHRLFAYQPGWLALPLGAIELLIVMGVASDLSIAAPRSEAVAFFVGSWLLAQVLVHAVFPLRRPSYGEDGGGLGRTGVTTSAAVVAVLAVAGGVAWNMRPPTVRLEAGIHRGPLVLDRRQNLVGEPGAVVLGGIRILADDVSVHGVTVRGGEYGIEVDGARDVVLDDVTVVGAQLDGIHVRRSNVHIRDCAVRATAGPYTQGIDISFGADLPPSVVERCDVLGGREGIVSHFAHVMFRDNHVVGSSLRGIATTEMSMGMVHGNLVEDALGVGIFCGDYSECEIEDNRVVGTRPDAASGDLTRLGYGIVAHYGARATLDDNVLVRNARGAGAFLRAELDHR
jgi:hypothetical protein